MVESYLHSIRIKNIKSAFLEPGNATVSLSTVELDRRFSGHFGLYLLAVNYLAKELYEEEIFTKNEKNKIYEDFGIPEAESLALERADINAIITKIREYRLDNLKDILILLRLRTGLFPRKSRLKSTDIELRNTNSVLNLIMRELIFLDHKFSIICNQSLENFKQMKKVLYSDLVNNYFLLCAYYFLHLYDKMQLNKKLKIKDNKIQPVKQLLTFLPQRKKFSKYSNLSDDSLLKFFFKVLAVDVIYNAKVYDFIHRQNPSQSETSQEPDVLRGPLKDMIDYLGYFNLIRLNQGNNSESLDPTQILALKQTMFFRFEAVINKLMSNLSQSMPIEEFKNSLAEKIQDYGLDEHPTAIFIEDLFKEYELERILKYPRFELENEISKILSKKATTEQIKEKLNSDIESLEPVRLKAYTNRHINFRNQKKQYKFLYNKFSNRPSLLALEKKDILKLRKKFLCIEEIELKLKSGFLEHIAETKEILTKFFSPRKKFIIPEIGKDDYPYNDRIKKCSNCIMWLNENLAKNYCAESEAEQQDIGDVEISTSSEEEQEEIDITSEEEQEEMDTVSKEEQEEMDTNQ